MVRFRWWPMRGVDPRDALLVAGLLAWAAALVAVRFDYVQSPGGARGTQALTYGVPLALIALTLLHRPSRTSALPLVAGAAAAVALALLVPSHLSTSPKYALAVPAVVVGAYLTNRYPTTSLALIFLITGTYGSIKAFTGIPADSVTDKVIDGVWAGIVGRLLVGRRGLTVRPTPALLMLGAFLGITIIAVFTTSSLANGIRAFRLAPLFLSMVLVIGYGGFGKRTLALLARAMVVVSLLVAAYAALRWAIGTSGKEQALQKTAFQQQYNRIAVTNDLKVQGSLPNGALLGLWLACTIPLQVAAAISWRGIFRWLALAGLPLAVIGLLGSAQRGAAAAVVAGGLTVIVVQVLSRGSRGPRLGVAIGAAVLLIASAVVAVPAVLNNPQKRARYTNLLTPSQDEPIQERLNKWRTTLTALRGRPFGYGLGAANPRVIPHRFADVAYYEVDNSFLMIAYDQGIAAMIVFAVAMLLLLVELLRHAVWTRGPDSSVLAAGAAGTLVAMLIEFMTANFVATPPVVAGWMVVGLGAAQLGRVAARPVTQVGAVTP
jgi:hypothetical protein